MLSGIRWDFLWQRHQILATLFARAGYKTIYVETTGLANPRPSGEVLRKVTQRLLRAGSRRRAPTTEENLTIYSPLVAPPTAGTFRRINRKLLVPRVTRDLRALAGESPVVIAYPPTQTTLDILSDLKPRLTLYDCSENYGGFPGIPKDVDRTEKELLRRADLVSCTSRFLLEKVGRFRPDAFLCGPGVDYERFRVLQGTRPPENVRAVCFFGHISEERVDFPVLRAIEGAGFTVRLVGTLGRLERDFLETPGVDYRGEAAHADLPAALAESDVFIIPYKANELTRGISPAKVYECLASGLPLVATPLPELVGLSEYVYLAEGPEQFVDVLRRLPELETEEKVRARIELAKENSWEVRFRKMEEAIWRKM